jgi:hypothetical protein
VHGAQLLEDANSTSANLVAVVDGKPVGDPATRAALRASRAVSGLPQENKGGLQ